MSKEFVNPKDDLRAFRNSLGNFATGVTIITAKDSESGEVVGVTANSFSSVSMDPPLVLWSLDKKAKSLRAYQEAGYYAVNVLAEDQLQLSNKFACQGEDKFDGVNFQQGEGGAPIIDGCMARFQCLTLHQYDGGDHIIFIGEVLAYDTEDREGLLFHQGNYAVSSLHPSLLEERTTESVVDKAEECAEAC